MDEDGQPMSLKTLNDASSILLGTSNSKQAGSSTRLADVLRARLVSFHEQALGANAYISQARDARGIIHGYRIFQKIVAGFAEAQVLPFDDAAEDVFAGLRSQRVRISTMDLRIAAIARSLNATVLSCNRRDFEKVPGLNVEDWSK